MIRIVVQHSETELNSILRRDFDSTIKFEYMYAGKGLYRVISINVCINTAGAFA